MAMIAVNAFLAERSNKQLQKSSEGARTQVIAWSVQSVGELTPINARDLNDIGCRSRHFIDASASGPIL